MRMTRGRSEHHDHGHGSADRRGWTGKPALRTRVVTEASDMTTAKYILGGRSSLRLGRERHERGPCQVGSSTSAALRDGSIGT